MNPSETIQTRNPQPSSTTNLQPNAGSLQPVKPSTGVLNGNNITQETIPLSAGQTLKVTTTNQPASASSASNNSHSFGLYLIFIFIFAIAMLVGAYAARRRSAKKLAETKVEPEEEFNKDNNFDKITPRKKKTSTAKKKASKKAARSKRKRR